MIYLGIAFCIVLAVFILTVLFGAPYVPSRRQDLETAFSQLYQVGPNDFLVDIGSGDGVVCRAATQNGARALGLEINPFLVLVAKWMSRKSSRTQFRLANFWRTDLPEETTIVYTFGESRDISRMVRYVERQATHLDKTLYFLSYGFALKDRKPLRKHGAHFLYEIDPLHPGEA